ncbi:hypothetical protein [Actinosynnema pretiosum]|nr:hypothetical protein [Actinosynnema pretiosum]
MTATAARMITAGAVLPGTDSTGEDRDTITARHYGHPALGERVVVKLVPSVLGKAEDLTAEFLGFSAPSRVEGVGTGKREALGFPAWALVNDPANGHHALNLVKDVQRLARMARSRAGAAKDGFTALGDMLGRSAPHFLPTFYEQAGRAFLEHGNTTYAATMFGKAREAEEVHDLEVDNARTREVFLEFAFAGALTAKALSAHAKVLLKRADPVEAYEGFLTLCVERTRGGLPPYTGMPEDLKRLVKAAKLDQAEQDERLLTALLDSASIPRAGQGFWKHYRTALVRMATADPEVRSHLLTFVPSASAALPLWLDIVTACGATRAYTDPVETAPAAPRPAAEWLSDVIAVSHSNWGAQPRLPKLLELAEAMAPRLVADGHEVRLLLGWRFYALDLLDLLLTEGVPIAEPKRRDIDYQVGSWLGDDEPGARDLAAVAASRFVDRLGDGVYNCLRARTDKGLTTVDALLQVLAVPGLRTALSAWNTARAADDAPRGLPALGERLEQLSVLAVPEVFADTPEVAQAFADTDVPQVLADTLRAGLFDELGWPALEEAVRALEAEKIKDDPGVVLAGGAWPVLVLRRAEKFVVVGPDGVLAEHQARIPADLRHRWSFEPTGTWHDGALLVRWQGPDEELGYWSDAPSKIFQTNRENSYYGGSTPEPAITTPAGLFTGGRLLQRGDTHIPSPRRVYGDGANLWALGPLPEGGQGLVEVDPATGELGRASLPAFLEDFAADGASLNVHSCSLRPSVPATTGSPLGEANGLHGWRVRRQADKSWLAEGVDGRRVHLTDGERYAPVGQLALPGGGKLTLVSHYRTIDLLDEHGVVVGSLDGVGQQHADYSAGTPLMPPMGWWHVLRPRDEAGSAALRAVTREAAEALLAAAVAEAALPKEERDELPTAHRWRLGALLRRVRGEKAPRDLVAEAVAGALPGLTHPALVVGVSDLVRRAAKLLVGYRAFAPVAEAARTTDLDALAPSGPVVSAEAVEGALDWFGGYRYRSGHSGATTLPELIAALGQAAAGPALAKALPHPDSTTWHKVLPELPALLHRAASPLTPEPEREALVLLLRSLADAGLVDGTGRWRVVGINLPVKTQLTKHAVLPLGGGFATFTTNSGSREDDTYLVEGLQFSPEPGRFALPPKATLSYSRELRGALTGADVLRFLDVLAERGPAPWRADAPEELAGLTGLGTSVSALLLAGMPEIETWGANFLTTEQRKLIGLSAAELKAARQGLRDTDKRFRRELLAAAVPADPVALWEGGPDVEAVARVWVDARGRRVQVPDDVLLDASKSLTGRSPETTLAALLNPERTEWLTTDARMHIVENNLKMRESEGFTGHHLTVSLEALTWLAYRLPAASPLRSRLPVALELVRARNASRDLAIQLGTWRETVAVEKMLGITADRTIGAITNHGGWLDVVTTSEEYCTLIAWPARVRPQDRAVFQALAEQSYSSDVIACGDLLATDGLTALCAAVAPEGTDPEVFFQDPAFSVPHLVEQAAERFGLSADAAVLYLQLLALPDPTDANTARWTGWKPARLKKARAELAETDLVLSAKRARAGRSLFLPGGWSDLKKPHLPVETWKAAMFDVAFGYEPAKRGGAIVPVEPVAALFERAWRRVLDGDAPAYEELRTGSRR